MEYPVLASCTHIEPNLVRIGTARPSTDTNHEPTRHLETPMYCIPGVETGGLGEEWRHVFVAHGSIIPFRLLKSDEKGGSMHDQGNGVIGLISTGMDAPINE